MSNTSLEKVAHRSVKDEVAERIATLIASGVLSVGDTLPSERDLATSMGKIGELGHPEVHTTIKDTLNRIRDAGRNSGTLVDNNDVREYVELGVKFLLTNVGSWIEAGASEFIQAAENT